MIKSLAETRELRAAEEAVWDCPYVFVIIIDSMEDLLSSSNL